MTDVPNDPHAVERMYDASGNVAVLISPGYGAGWSTWVDSGLREFALFDKGLAEMALRDADETEVKDYIEKTLGSGVSFYTGGWDDITIVFLPRGKAFRIIEHDGNESLSTADDDIFTA